MPTLTRPQPHTLTLPPELFARLVEIADQRGDDPHSVAIAALTSFVSTPEPAWKAKLRAGQEAARQAFAASGKTDEDIVEDTEAEVKAYRAERRARDTQPV